MHSTMCPVGFFFQAEDGIRDADVTGVQTCALPILAGNRRLDKRVRRLLGRAGMQARTTGETATLYGETRYAARRWDRKRRIIMKAEVLCYPCRSRKDNPRFLVTNLPHRPATVYTRL